MKTSLGIRACGAMATRLNPGAHAEDAVGAVKRPVLPWRCIDGVAAADELVYAALGA